MEQINTFEKKIISSHSSLKILQISFKACYKKYDPRDSLKNTVTFLIFPTHYRLIFFPDENYAHNHNKMRFLNKNVYVLNVTFTSEGIS